MTASQPLSQGDEQSQGPSRCHDAHQIGRENPHSCTDPDLHFSGDSGIELVPRAWPEVFGWWSINTGAFLPPPVRAMILS